MLERLRSDLIDAVRSLLATPVTTFATVLLLAVATGANLAVFGLIDRAILTPARHVVRPDRLFTLAFGVPGDAARGAGMTSTSYVAFDTIREHAPAMARVAAWRRTSTTVVVSGEQMRADAMLVSGSYFAVLGAVPRLGRVIEPADDEVSSATAVISHAFWRSAFGGDPGVLGRQVTVNRIEYVVSGVMPPGFSGHSATRVDVWVPFAAAMRDVPGWNRDAFRNFVSIIARVEAGEDVAAAQQASAALERRVSLVGLDGGDVAPTERRIAFALAGVSVLVLVIGLANAATLLLVRGTRRRRESAIRAALGATRGRLFARVLLEAAILASMATAGALVLSSWLGEAVRRLLLAGVIENEGLTLRTVLVALVAGVAALALAAFVGLLQLPRHVRSGDLSGAGSGARRSRAYPMLLLVQTTLSVVLIAGAGMFGRSLFNLRAQDFGMRLSDVVLVGFEPGPRPVAEQAAIFRAALERVRSMPGVESATVVQSMPFTGFTVPPIGVPGMAESPSVNGQLPYLDRGDAGVFRDSRHRDRAGPAIHTRRRAERAGRHRQSDHGTHGVARRERARQVHPDWIRSVVRSLDRGWAARAADDGGVPRGRRRRPRRPPAVGRPGRRRRSPDAGLRAVLAGARPARWRRRRSRDPGPADSDVSRGRQPHRADSSRGRRRPHRSAVCRSPPLQGPPRATDAARGVSVRRCCHSLACWRWALRGSGSMPCSRTPLPSAGARWRSASRSAPNRAACWE